MNMLAIGALLRAGGERISAVLRWLLDHPLQLALIIAAAWIAWAQLVTIPRRDATIAAGKAQIATLRGDLGARTRERDAERVAHQATKQTYRAAQAAAAELERQRLVRVAAEQQEITDDVAEDYRTRLAAARAAADRLRHQLARSGAGAGGAAATVDLPGAGGAAGGAAAPAGDRRLPFDAGELAWRLTATEQAIQLDELITWIERQTAVDPNR